jgi:hypothetical protein
MHTSYSLIRIREAQKHTDPATVLIIEPVTRIRIKKNYVCSCGFVIWPKKRIQSHSIEITTGPKREVKVTEINVFVFLYSFALDGRIRIRIRANNYGSGSAKPKNLQILHTRKNTLVSENRRKNITKSHESLYLEFHLCFRASRGPSAWLSPVQQHLPATSGKLIYPYSYLWT